MKNSDVLPSTSATAATSSTPATANTANTVLPAAAWMPEFGFLAAIWGSSFLFTRIGALEFGFLPTAFVRVAVAALFLLPLVALRGALPDLRLHWRRVFFVGVMNSAIPFACFSYALLSITTGLASILNATVPMFGALAAWLWLKDRPDGSRIAGLAIGFAGVFLLAWEKSSFVPNASGVASGWAVLACLFACVCYGFSASYTRRYLTGVPPLVTAAGSQIGATLALLLPALWFWPAQMPSTNAWLALTTVGVFSTGIAYVLFFRLIEKAGPPRALSVTFVVPVFAMLYGAVFIDERITPWMIGCGAIIVCGTALASGLIRLRGWRP